MNLHKDQLARDIKSLQGLIKSKPGGGSAGSAKKIDPVYKKRIDHVVKSRFAREDSGIRKSATKRKNEPDN